MTFKEDLTTLLHCHYIANIILCCSFVFLKTVYPICAFVFPASNCELDWREWEILTFLAIVLVFRTRRSGSTTMLAYLTSSFMYIKMANLILYFYSDPRLGLFYGVLCILQLLLLPEPAYKGPENITYFRGPSLMEEINSDRRVTWLITFYAAWSPTCAQFAPVFAKLSGKYSLPNLKFGKVDVARFPAIAKDFNINDSSFSRQLPTIICFRNGKEVLRRPLVDSNKRVAKFFFNDNNTIMAFDLNNLHEECKNNPIKDRKKKDDTPVSGKAKEE